MRRWRSIALALSLLLAAQLFLTACSPDDFADVVDFFKSWAEDEGLIDKDGNPSVMGILGAKLGDDKDAQALVDAGEAVQSIATNDQRAAEAKQEGNPDKVTAAINARPGEYRYYSDRAAIYAAQGKMDLARRDIEAATQMAQKLGGQAEVQKERAHRDAAIRSQYDRIGADLKAGKLGQDDYARASGNLTSITP